MQLVRCFPLFMLVACGSQAEPAEPADPPQQERQSSPWDVLGEEPALPLSEHAKEVRVRGPGGVELWVGAYEVSQGVYEALIGHNPSADPTCKLRPPGPRGEHWVRPDYPVTCVSWNDAISFANLLSERDNLELAYRRHEDTVTRNPEATGYRLPSFEEWEWIARAGTDAPRDPWCYAGNDSNPGPDAYLRRPAPLRGCTGPGYIRRIGSHTPNGWGLHHTTGNVGEIVGEPGMVETRGLRVGRFSGADYSTHYPSIPTKKSPVRGFRLVRPATSQAVER